MKQRGIVLSSIDYKEASRIVYLYTPIGKMSIKATGANKAKNGLLGFITTGNIVSFVSTDNQFPSVIEYDIIESTLIKNESLRVIEAIGCMFDVIKYFPDDINHFKTYGFIENILLNINDKNYLKCLSIFLIKMTYNFGVAPNLRSCTICGAKNNLAGFRVSNGGAVCSSCMPGVKNKDLLDIWDKYYHDKLEIDKYEDFDFDLLLKSLLSYYRTHIHISLKIDNLLK